MVGRFFGERSARHGNPDTFWKAHGERIFQLISVILARAVRKQQGHHVRIFYYNWKGPLPRQLSIFIRNEFPTLLYRDEKASLKRGSAACVEGTNMASEKEYFQKRASLSVKVQTRVDTCLNEQLKRVQAKEEKVMESFRFFECKLATGCVRKRSGDFKKVYGSIFKNSILDVVNKRRLADGKAKIDMDKLQSRKRKDWKR
jgi:hypothetical protein